MAKYIDASVGAGAKNNKDDVKLVQAMLNLHADMDRRLAHLGVDGDAGDKTKKAIVVFQRLIVKLRVPDGRIDAGGRSERALVGALDKDDIDLLLKKYKSKPAPPKSAPGTVHYRQNARREVSQYSMNIIKLAMAYANISKVDISSTRRTVADQARIMYENCQRYNVSDVNQLRAKRGWGYAAAGRAVETVYFANKSKPKEKVLPLMQAKITAYLQKGVRVSRHCADLATYNRYNVLDIPYSSVSVKKREFEAALIGMSKDIKSKKAWQKKPNSSQEFISVLIIEDACWHIEIAQDNKTLPKI